MIEREKSIRAQQVQIMYGHTKTAVVSHPFAGALFVWIFWGVGDQRMLLGWLTCLVLVSAVRAVVYIAFLRRPPDAAVQRWGDVNIALIFLQGVVWGAAWLIFMPEADPFYHAFIAMFVMGLSGAGAIGYTSHLAALLAFFVPVVAPGAIGLFVIGGEFDTALGLALVLYTVVLMRALLPVNKSMVDAIESNLNLELEIERRKKVEDKLRQISLQDGLTGLSNRRHFDQVLEDELRRAVRAAYPVSLIMLDIDNFKAFNDTYGHVEGDACLQRISRVLQQAINRPGDLAARYGGEEFAVILSNTEAINAYIIAEAIRDNVTALKIPHEGSEIADFKFVTISAGVASVIPERGSTTPDIVDQADRALYKAKADGKNRVMVT